MDKVKLTKRQAEALEVAKELPVYVKKSDIVRLHNVKWGGPCRALNEIDLDTLIKALYIGYEVEQTPEDKVRELYQFWDNYEGDSIYSGQTIASHISDVLNLLNIKIEGVNA